jgi:hypothetical protein
MMRGVTPDLADEVQSRKVQIGLQTSTVCPYGFFVGFRCFYGTLMDVEVSSAIDSVHTSSQ